LEQQQQQFCSIEHNLYNLSLYCVQGAHAGSECYWSRCFLFTTESCHKVAASAAAVLRMRRRRQQLLEAKVARKSMH